ncbi:MAG: nuclear transport factor 2 family protein, partial [Saprospiraceae bacterium]
MITEKKELLFATYQSFMDQVLGLCEPDTLRDILLVDAMGFGTTTDEKIFGADAFLNLIKIQNKQSEGLGFKWKIDPLSRYVSPAEDSAAFADDIYLNFDVNGEKIEMYLRISVILEYRKDKWLVVHWHGSKPEEVQSEEDTFGIESWKQKVETLEKLVAERTSELVEKNRELEIETALEKVRATALAMKELADMVDVCHVISDQLELLHVKDIRNVQTAIIYETKGVYFNYEYYTKHNKELITEVDYQNHELQTKFAKQMLSGAEELFTVSIKDKELKDWYTYQKTTNQYADAYLENAEILCYYWYSLGPVALGISTYFALTEDEINLFKRFRNVFELAYRRYLDIEQAIAQAKEARLETALERVRAAAMAMRKLDELPGICETLYNELNSLGFNDMRNSMINIYNDEKATFVNYDYSDEIGKSINHLHYNIHPVIEKQIKQLRSANDAFSESVFEGKDLEDMKTFRIKIGEKDDPRINNSAAIYYYFYSIGNGSIGISSFNSLTPEKLEVLKRFRNVFSLAYQRYTDISLAEAQAREAQIEAALERVRSRSMGMQKSEELKDVIQVVYQQFVHLNINTEHTGFVMDYKERDDRLIWVASKYGLPSQFTIPYFDSIYYNRFNEAKAKGWDFFATNLSFEEKNTFYRELFTYFPELPEEDKKFYFSCPGLAISTVLLDNIGLYIENFTGTPYTDEENSILMRFGKVFQQTYTRFLDLLKAEAQVREAQIETALERVRARTMAMQKSIELADASRILFGQMNLLVPNLWSCGFVLCDKNKTVDEWWLSGGNGYMPDLVLPNVGDVTHANIYKAWLQGASYHEEMVEGEALQEHYRWLMTIPVAKAAFDAQAAADIPTPVWQQLSCAYFTQGYLVVITEMPYHEADILKRFAKVFEQTYTRFLDLQKAEAQAREAQIEAALERIRSRSLAMYKTDDLGEVVSVLFQQMQGLNVDMSFASVSIFIFEKDSRNITQWIQLPDGVVSLRIPYFEHPISFDLFNAKASGVDYFSKVYT